MDHETLHLRLKNNFPEFSAPLIDEIIEKGKHKFIPSDEVIMDAGKMITEIPLLLKGRIKVYRPDDSGNELFLYFLYPGDACAISLSCSYGNQRISRIRAETEEECEVLAVPIHHMDEWMLQHRTWYYFVLGTYRFRFEEILKTLDSIAFHKLDERLVIHLKKLREAQGSDHLENITHQDIAYELNSSREVISRLLKKLEQRGHIHLGRNHIQLLDIDSI